MRWTMSCRAAAALALLSSSAVLAQDDAKALLESGTAKIKAEDYPGAIQDLSKAIELDPTSAQAWKERGRARYLSEDLDGSIADYGRAIELDPGFKMAYNNRSVARRAKGDYAGALRDAERALEIDPGFDYAYINRGIARILSGDSAGGEADILRSVELGTTYLDYPQLWLWVERFRRGEREAADKALAEFRGTRGEALEGWTAGLFDLLLGKVPEEEFARRIEEGPAGKLAHRQAEGFFYLGMMRLRAGDRAGAKALFEKSVAAGVASFIEHHLAKRELEGLSE